MNFASAVELAAAGSAIRRESWGSIGGSLMFVTTTRTVAKSAGSASVIGTYTETSGLFSQVTAAGGTSAYQLSLTDVLADDWVVVE